VIALVVAVLLIVLAVLYYRRRQRHPRTDAGDPGFQVDNVAPDAALGMRYTYTPVTQDVGATSSTPSHHVQPFTSVSSGSPRRKGSPLPPSGARQPSSKGTRGTLPRDLSAGLPANSELTDEQVDFAHGLYAHNVPIPTIAHMLERMRRTGDANPPPDYDSAI
jgi:hypothetical protein